jgi:hypothetical protein
MFSWKLWDKKLLFNNNQLSCHVKLRYFLKLFDIKIYIIFLDVLPVNFKEKNFNWLYCRWRLVSLSLAKLFAKTFAKVSYLLHKFLAKTKSEIREEFCDNTNKQTFVPNLISALHNSYSISCSL